MKQMQVYTVYIFVFNQGLPDAIVFCKWNFTKQRSRRQGLIRNIICNDTFFKS